MKKNGCEFVVSFSPVKGVVYCGATRTGEFLCAVHDVVDVPVPVALVDPAAV